VPTGKVSPAVPLSGLSLPIHWTWDSAAPADVLFAGLAPGLIGYYQVDARIPANAATSPLALTLGWVPPEGGESNWLLAGIPVAPQ
jgi:uncharacterized protein (TIGR03437 family)